MFIGVARVFRPFFAAFASVDREPRSMFELFVEGVLKMLRGPVAQGAQWQDKIVRNDFEQLQAVSEGASPGTERVNRSVQEVH